ncbi:MAG: EAL domain-containing protein [Firmicutes bacterium]|nr:EAL domain-containing protein [Candidatus Fiminaster equi]
MYVINQIYGLAIAVILLVLFLTTKRLTLKGTSSFLRTIIIVIICLFFDALSCVAIKHWKDSNPALVEFICKTYLITMIWVGWTNFCYVCLDLNSTKARHNRLCFIMAGITIVMSAAIASVPINVVLNGEQMYTDGIAVILTYVFTLFYIVSSVVVAVYVLKFRNRRRGFAVIFSHVIWIIASGVQALNNAFLLVGLAMAVGLLILYIIMENPDAHIDRSLECYSSSAFNEYLDYMFSKTKEFYILDISVTSTSAMEGKGVDIQKEVKKLIHFASKNRKIHIFKTFNVGIAIVSEDRDCLTSAVKGLIDVAKAKQVLKNILVLNFNDISKISNTFDLIKLMTFARQQFAEKTGEINVISHVIVENFLSIDQINNDILKALDDDRVETFYQPIYNCQKGTFEIAEALCRIRLENGSLMSPGKFIPVSESTGSVALLGERIYRNVCDFYNENNIEKFGVRNIDINLSAVQCDNIELAKKFNDIAKEKGIKPSLISFEITETAFSSVKANMLTNMNEMIQNGFEFALDDFGKGASNLMYAIEMPIKIIKIDMELTKLFMQDEKAKAVVNAIIKMAHDMNLKVVSEGVETEEEVEIIKKAGIDYIQGYYFSKPLPKEEYLNFLKEHQ